MNSQQSGSESGLIFHPYMRKGRISSFRIGSQKGLVFVSCQAWKGVQVPNQFLASMVDVCPERVSRFPSGSESTSAARANRRSKSQINASPVHYVYVTGVQKPYTIQSVPPSQAAVWSTPRQECAVDNFLTASMPAHYASAA